jgi:hypothetical protein
LEAAWPEMWLYGLTNFVILLNSLLIYAIIAYFYIISNFMFILYNLNSIKKALQSENKQIQHTQLNFSFQLLAHPFIFSCLSLFLIHLLSTVDIKTNFYKYECRVWQCSQFKFRFSVTCSSEGEGRNVGYVTRTWLLAPEFPSSSSRTHVFCCRGTVNRMCGIPFWCLYVAKKISCSKKMDRFLFREVASGVIVV